MDKAPKEKGMISIDIDGISYTPERVAELTQQMLSDDFNA